MLQTLRSHHQFNTTIYGPDDRYCGIKAGRRVVFVNPADLDAVGFAEGQYVVAYATARGCAAAYFPENNVLVPLDSVAHTSNTPASERLVVRPENSGRPPDSAEPPDSIRP
ncbi:MAG: hypothetical protein JWQ32_493 [Marmoricola sp.]|nr:hypothetical protein [Marmoricola sp.]